MQLLTRYSPSCPETSSMLGKENRKSKVLDFTEHVSPEGEAFKFYKTQAEGRLVWKEKGICESCCCDERTSGDEDGLSLDVAGFLINGSQRRKCPFPETTINQ